VYVLTEFSHYRITIPYRTRSYTHPDSPFDDPCRDRRSAQHPAAPAAAPAATVAAIAIAVAHLAVPVVKGGALAEVIETYLLLPYQMYYIIIIITIILITIRTNTIVITVIILIVIVIILIIVIQICAMVASDNDGEARCVVRGARVV
jgi:hypothetical protein